MGNKILIVKNVNRLHPLRNLGLALWAGHGNWQFYVARIGKCCFLELRFYFRLNTNFPLSTAFSVVTVATVFSIRLICFYVFICNAELTGPAVAFEQSLFCPKIYERVRYICENGSGKAASSVLYGRQYWKFVFEHWSVLESGLADEHPRTHETEWKVSLYDRIEKFHWPELSSSNKSRVPSQSI